MFTLGLLIGIYSYFILLLGFSSLLYKETIIGGFILIPIFILVFKYKKITNYLKKGIKLNLKYTKFEWSLISLIAVQAIINLIGVFGPEISFDALWYHLTLPKLYLIEHSINFIPGGLLYYSTMPKLIDMLYVFGLSLGSEIFPKLIHYIFGILTIVAIYKLSRHFLNKRYSLIAVIIFYSNLVVGWESITAYIDLGRAFFEILALWAFINWIKEKKKKWLVESSVMLGLAISTKLIALQSLIIFIVLIFYVLYRNKIKTKKIFKNIFLYIFFSLLIPLPWFVFSYLNTGNFVYPFFDDRINTGIGFQIPNFSYLISDFVNIFSQFSYQISPIYLILLPLALIIFKRFNKNLKIITIYSILTLIILYLLPKAGAERFVLPYLPVFSIICSATIYSLREIRLKKYLIALVILISLISIIYRGVANIKFLPVILNNQLKTDFLAKNLNYNFGDFYDIDGYFENRIKKEDRVLLFGFHNLFYVNFPFIDSSWVKKGDGFNYIATQNTNLPDRFKNWKLIYKNDKTNVKLYNLYNLTWHY